MCQYIMQNIFFLSWFVSSYSIPKILQCNDIKRFEKTLMNGRSMLLEFSKIINIFPRMKFTENRHRFIELKMNHYYKRWIKIKIKTH